MELKKEFVEKRGKRERQQFHVERDERITYAKKIYDSRGRRIGRRERERERETEKDRERKTE